MTFATGPFVNLETDGGFNVIDERTGTVLATGLTEQQSWDRQGLAFADYLSQKVQEAALLNVRDRVYVNTGDEPEFMAIVTAAYRATDGSLYFDVEAQNHQVYTGITPLQIRSGAPVDFGH